jgi:hypothetical protein
MPTEYQEHQIIKDVRELRGHADDVSHDQIYKAEAMRLALLPHAERVHELRAFDNKVELYNQNHGLRQQAQAHRFGQYLKTAHERLKGANR